MKKVLVIGAHSYIGQNFNEYVTINNLEDLTVNMVSASDGAWRKVDFSGYDTVLHLSGIVHRKEKKNMEAFYYEVNYKLAVEIAERAKDSRIKQFIFMSTAAVYGSYTGCITKDTLPNPNTFYGKSKLAAELDIIKLQNEEFKVVIVRPPMVYGEGCKGNFPRLVKLAKYTPIFPEFHNKRSVLNINTLSAYLVDILVENKGGYIYPQDDKYFSTCEFIINIKKDIGKKIILCNKFNLLIRIFRYRFKVLSKLFGDMYYER